MISTMSPDHTPDLSDNPVLNRVPSVSVVIPAWNRRDTLRMSVESVLRQTYEDFELIVVDDGSTDGTMEAIADITAPRLRRLSSEITISACRHLFYASFGQFRPLTWPVVSAIRSAWLRRNQIPAPSPRTGVPDSITSSRTRSRPESC